MSREILVRAKSEKDDQWYEGYYVQFEKIIGIIPIHYIGYTCDGQALDFAYTEVYPETIGQYTGREDKNMNKIFEGDIVLSPMGNKMIVFWSEKYCSFGLKSQDWAFVHWFGEAVEPEECKIIGNIHEKHL